ncbi:MAG: TerB family tellurite resistance protein, partial [Cyclobacteriaceae bacterium]|nr:TerB family tellurite resistance protein [Cyclobacteriaceae bacterium]
MIKDQLNILINLAASDTTVAEKEASVIYSLAKANGIPKEAVDEMLKRPHPIVSFDTFTEDEKFENLYHLIQLMK